MRIPRVFVGTELAVGVDCELPPDRAHYLKNVLRLKTGAAVFLFDGKTPADFSAVIEIDGKRVLARVEGVNALNNESALDTTIILGLGRGDHVDWSLQKCTELGASRFVLFNAERTQKPLKPAQLEKKQLHWQAITVSACEQCGRAVRPQVEFCRSLAQALDTTTAGLGLLLDFTATPLVSALTGEFAEVAILLGPEGGLTEAEIEQARAAGYRAVGLGPRVLRTETAATAALAIVQSSLDDGRRV